MLGNTICRGCFKGGFRNGKQDNSSNRNEQFHRNSFESAYDMLTAELADLFKQHSYLLDSDQMDVSDRAIYERLKDNRATTAEIKKLQSF